jgi:hypothetical protein
MSGNSVLTDGRTGKTATVDDYNRLVTFSTVQDDRTASSLTGNTFIITHPIITLTSDNESVLLYVKNTDSVPWTVDSFAASIGPSTGGPGGTLTNRFIAAVTDGTILAGADAFALNTNLGSANPLNGEFKYGGEGFTAIGSPGVQALIVSDQRAGKFSDGPIVVANGTSFAISFTPPTGNTSLLIQLTVSLHREVVA